MAARPPISNDSPPAWWLDTFIASAMKMTVEDEDGETETIGVTVIKEQEVDGAYIASSDEYLLEEMV